MQWCWHSTALDFTQIPLSMGKWIIAKKLLIFKHTKNFFLRPTAHIGAFSCARPRSVHMYEHTSSSHDPHDRAQNDLLKGMERAKNRACCEPRCLRPKDTSRRSLSCAPGPGTRFLWLFLLLPRLFLWTWSLLALSLCFICRFLQSIFFSVLLDGEQSQQKWGNTKGKRKEGSIL